MAGRAETDRERQFAVEVWAGIRELRALGYNPKYFIDMVVERTAAQAVRDLVDSPAESEGFDRLWGMKRLDVSAEAIVADQPEWADLFTDEQRAKARRRLELRGYTFRHTPFTAPTTGTDWTDAECAAVTRDYFEMLSAELLRRPYNKAEHNRRLQQITGRSSGSIEFKHANISAVLVNQQQPYIDGYKPRGNYQAKLAEAVTNYLNEHPDFFTTTDMLAAIEPETAPSFPLIKIADLFEAPPDLILPSPDSTPWLSRRGRRVNFAERDARNRHLGRLGEQFMLELERRRLNEAGRDDLAGRVEWVADTCGDGLGYDVLSFNANTDAERWLEVKTTGLGKYHPFLVTANELRCSEAEPDRFELTRVFEFRKSPRVFVLSGSLTVRCDLRPSVYLAAPREQPGSTEVPTP